MITRVKVKENLKKIRISYKIVFKRIDRQLILWRMGLGWQKVVFLGCSIILPLRIKKNKNKY